MTGVEAGFAVVAAALLTMSLAGVVQLRGNNITAPRCATEDSRNCLWLAPSSGNGRGRSFLDVDGRVYYLGGAP